MNLADVRVGIRVKVAGSRYNQWTGPTCRYGTVSGVEGGDILVVLDMDIFEAGPAHAHSFPVAFPCARVERETPARVWNTFQEPPLLTPVPTTVEQLVQPSIAEADAMSGSGLAEWMRNHHPMDARHLSGNGSNLAEWVRDYRAMDDPSIQRQIADEPAYLRRMRELAEQPVPGSRTLARDYIAAFPGYLAGVGMGQVPKEIAPAPKPLAIGTPPRKLCLPPKP